MRRGTQTILLAASLVLIVTALRAPLLPIPLERDEGEYAYIAWRLGHNELPYRDWFDQKPPAVFFIYWVALTLPFESIRAIHFVGLVFEAASTYALFFRGKNGWRRAAPFVAWSAMGLLTVVGLVVLYFWRRGGLPEFVDNVFAHN